MTRSDKLKVISTAMSGAAYNAIELCTYHLLRTKLEELGFVMPDLPEIMRDIHFNKLLDWPDREWNQYVVEPVNNQNPNNPSAKGVKAALAEIISKADQW